MKTAGEQVTGLIERLAPDPVCSSCIGDRLDIRDDENIDHIMSELAGTSGYESRIEECVLCGDTKRVIRKNG